MPDHRIADSVDGLPAAQYDTSPATKHQVEMMITKRLMDFHQALVDRGQIKPIPPKEEWPAHHTAENRPAA